MGKKKTIHKTPRELHDAWLSVAHDHYALKKELPIVFDMELYQYMDQPVKIISVNQYRGGCEVTIENRWSSRQVIEVDRLDLRSKS